MGCDGPCMISTDAHATHSRTGSTALFNWKHKPTHYTSETVQSCNRGNECLVVVIVIAVLSLYTHQHTACTIMVQVNCSVAFLCSLTVFLHALQIHKSQSQAKPSSQASDQMAARPTNRRTNQLTSQTVNHATSDHAKALSTAPQSQQNRVPARMVAGLLGRWKSTKSVWANTSAIETV